jgi:hypothetical protein
VSPCPHCGANTEPGQLVCVECGGRLALSEEPPEGTPTPRATPVVLALLLAVMVLGAGGLGYALAKLSDDDDEAPAAERAAQPAPSAEPGEPQEPARAETATEPQDPPPERRRLLLDWPDELTAHTVVLVTTGDRPAARRVAVEAARSGLEAGLLRSDDFDLGTGLWIVFAGRFDNRASAVRQATNLAERYPGAYAQLVQPTGQ